MNRRPIEPVSPEIESLLASERVLVREPEEVRSRAVLRAQAALPRRRQAYFAGRWPSGSRKTLIVAAAASLVLIALGALAFQSMYRATLKVAAEPIAAEPKLSPMAPSTASPLSGSTGPVVSGPTAAVGGPPEPSSNSRVVESSRTATDSGAYALELRLLQRAHQAVARNDFASALATIAEHERRFASGRLIEEREALRVKALVGLGRSAEARRTAALFRERFPRSILVRRIDDMLQTSP